MKKLSYILFFILLLSISAFAQTASPTPPKASEEDVVKISTTLIQVDVTVTDKKGNLITDLKPEDFEILENGKAQKLTNFSFVSLAPQPAEGTSSTTGKINPKDKLAPPTPTFKLRPEQVRRTIALVVDDLGLSFESTDLVRSLLKRFVDEQMQPNDLVAIIRTGSGMGVLQQFTSDKRVLYAAIKKVRWNMNGRVGVSSFATIEPTLADERSGGIDANTGKAHEVSGKDHETAAGNEVNNFREDIFSVGTLGAVNYIVRGMRELPGRKAVMLFSEGFTSSITRDTRVVSSMRNLTELANRSGVIIYAADPRGLVPPGFTAGDDVSDKVQNPDNNYADAQLRIRESKTLESQGSLRTLAEATGGFAITNQNLGAWSIRQMLKDQNGYYLIGYQPDSETFDPKKNRFNKLTVRVKRDDVKVRYRSGFFGITDENMRQAPKTSGQQIYNALTSPFGANGVNLNLYAISGNDAKTGDFIRSLVYIDVKDLKFTQEADGKRKANFDIIAMTFGDNGVPVDEVSKNYTIQVSEILYQKVLEKGFVYNLPIQIKKPGAYQFRIALRDSGSEKVGSASQFVEVPNLKKKNLSVSKLIPRQFYPRFPNFEARF